jgi:hypothetical protein
MTPRHAVRFSRCGPDSVLRTRFGAVDPILALRIPILGVADLDSRVADPDSRVADRIPALRTGFRRCGTTPILALRTRFPRPRTPIPAPRTLLQVQLHDRGGF